MANTATIAENAAFVLESDDVFNLLKSDPSRMEAFAGAFEVPFDIFEGAFKTRVEAEATIEAEKGRVERISGKAIKWNEYVTDAEGVNAYTVPGSLIALMERGRELAAAMSDKDSEVAVGFDIGFNTDGVVVFTVRATGISATKKKGSGNTRKTYNYFFDGKAIEGRLKPFVLKTFPDSDAAKDILDHDPKTGTKKGAKSAFDCCEDDVGLNGMVTRIEKVKEVA